MTLCDIGGAMITGMEAREGILIIHAIKDRREMVITIKGKGMTLEVEEKWDKPWTPFKREKGGIVDEVMSKADLWEGSIGGPT